MKNNNCAKVIQIRYEFIENTNTKQQNVLIKKTNIQNSFTQ